MKIKGILVAVGAVLLLGGIYFFMTSKNKGAMDESAGMMGGSTTLMELMAKGISQKCTYKDVTDEYEASGTTYISGGKVRGDFTTTVGDQTQTGHTIYDDKISYVWMDGQQNGYIINSESTPSDEGEEVQTQKGIDLNKSIDYRCDSWNSDDSMFVPPTDVEFLVFEVPSSGRLDVIKDEADPCDSCSLLTGEQQTQCLTSLNCN